MMRVGLLARSEYRGLGNQSVSVLHGLKPDRVLLVEPSPASWPQHPERFAHHRRVTHVHWRKGWLNPEAAVKRFLRGLDAVYTAESCYDPRLPLWAEDVGCVVVRHANPEQLAPHEVENAGPTVWWSATPWRLEHLPPDTRVVPLPVDPPKGFAHQPAAAKPLRFVHPVGHQAQDDRAGSKIVHQAIKALNADCQVHVWCQDRRTDTQFGVTGAGVDLRLHMGGVDDHWDQYRGGDVLVLPRRYGGLSLPSQEAMAAGLVLVMTDCSPNEVWPGLKIPVRQTGRARMRCGKVQVHDADPVALAEIMARLAGDRDEVAKWQAESLAWAEANSWEALRPLWLSELRFAAGISVGRVG